MEAPQSLVDKSILIIDDESSILNLTRSYLSSAGFKNIFCCTESPKALRMIEEKEFDLIVCDWNMPKYSGLDILATVKGEGVITNTKFLMITATSETSLVKTAIQAGVDGYLVKPFQVGKLLNYAIKLLQAHQRAIDTQKQA